MYKLSVSGDFVENAAVVWDRLKTRCFRIIFFFLLISSSEYFSFSFLFSFSFSLLFVYFVFYLLLLLLVASCLWLFGFRLSHCLNAA